MIEYERKLVGLAPLSESGPLELGTPQLLVDYFPPGDAAYFGVRFRTADPPGASGLDGCASASLAGHLTSAQLTIKGSAGTNARYEQNHTVIGLHLCGFPCTAKLRIPVLGVRGVSMPSTVACTLDIVLTAQARPVMEIEALAEGEAAAAEVDRLAHVVAGVADHPWSLNATAPRYRDLARVLPPGFDIEPLREAALSMLGL